MEIGWDGILQEDGGIFDMELEDISKLSDDYQNFDSMVCLLFI